MMFMTDISDRVNALDSTTPKIAAWMFTLMVPMGAGFTYLAAERGNYGFAAVNALATAVSAIYAKHIFAYSRNTSKKPK